MLDVHKLHSLKNLASTITYLTQLLNETLDT